MKLEKELVAASSVSFVLSLMVAMGADFAFFLIGLAPADWLRVRKVSQQ